MDTDQQLSRGRELRKEEPLRSQQHIRQRWEQPAIICCLKWVFRDMRPAYQEWFAY